MKTITTKWFTDNLGPKMFYSDSKRIQIHECSIAQFEDFKSVLETDFNFEGIYILLGTDGEKNRVYVGETDSIKNRLIQHFKDDRKKFAERIVVISSKDNLYPFSKTELHYLEKKLIRKFTDSNFEIENSNEGQGKQPNSIERASLDEELELIFLGLESFGVDFEKDDIAVGKSTSSIGSNERGDLEVYAESPRSENKIFGIFHPDNSLTIKKGSFIKYRTKPGGSSPENTRKALNQLQNSDKAIVVGDINGYEVTFTDDIRFKSATGAAYLIAGGVANGWHEWRLVTSNERIDKFRE